MVSPNLLRREIKFYDWWLSSYVEVSEDEVIQRMVAHHDMYRTSEEEKEMSFRTFDRILAEKVDQVQLIEQYLSTLTNTLMNYEQEDKVSKASKPQESIEVRGRGQVYQRAHLRRNRQPTTLKYYQADLAFYQQLLDHPFEPGVHLFEQLMALHGELKTPPEIMNQSLKSLREVNQASVIDSFKALEERVEALERIVRSLGTSSVGFAPTSYGSGYTGGYTGGSTGGYYGASSSFEEHISLEGDLR